MADVALPAPQTDDDDVTYGITLGGVQVRYRLRWWSRLSGWYLRLYTPDGTLVSDWHRVVPDARVTFDVTAAGHPPGMITCSGVGNGTARSDLWTSMELQYNDGVLP